MKKTSLADIGELEIIRRCCRRLPQRADVLVGPGDDCAVVRLPGNQAYDWLLTSDPVIQGEHFTSRTPGRLIGHKALARALSDIAAMGGEPLWALLDIVAPPKELTERVKQVFNAVAALARRYDLAVVGGDSSAGALLEVHVFVVGRVKKGQALLRSGARPGHNLFVTGSLGGSLAGKHLRFNPRLKEGQWLCQQSLARAMIDISDGLACDLRRLIVSSKVGAELWLKALPLTATARQVKNKSSAIRHALTDGEDFELLFSVPADKTQALQRGWQKRFSLKCTQIGVITDRLGAIETLDERGIAKPLTLHGYEHFR